MSIHHVIHGIDRDGWGFAALLIASFGPSICRIHPTREKNVILIVLALPLDRAHSGRTGRNIFANNPEGDSK